MNNDLISREYLRDAFDNLCCHNCKTCRNFRKEGCSFYRCALIDNAPTIETSKIEHKAYNEGFKDGVEQGIRLSDRPQGKWYDHVEDSLLKARHGKHVLYDVDYLLDHLAHEVSIMEQVRQMRDKEI